MIAAELAPAPPRRAPGRAPGRALDVTGDAAPAPPGRSRAGLGLAVALLGTFAFTAAAPLTDPDLPMHLSVGEWIVAHRALPTTEPFSWTRAGAPFYAYSWLAQVTYFLALRAVGPVGLHVVQALVATAGVAAVWWMARTAGWSRWTATVLAWAHLLALPTLALVLRPHGFLFVATPLAWAAGLRLVRALGPSAGASAGPTSAGVGRLPRWPFVLWWAAAALAANTHLLAPVVLAPLALLLPHARRRAPVVGAAAGAAALGLLTTPYVRHWPGVLALNFAPNALFRYPSPVTEHTAGVLWVARNGMSMWLPIVAALLAVAWVRREGVVPWSAWADRLLALAWLGGLLMFALSVRGASLWWLLSLPLAGAALARVPRPSDSRAGAVIRAAVLLTPWPLAASTAPLLAAGAPHEGTVARRVLPNPTSRSAVMLADSLERAAPNRAGRVVTTFQYGSALMWRLPAYSMSIDGRTIFPDSAALMDAYVVGHASARLPTPTGSADAAVVPLGSRIDTQLATEAGWRRLAVWRPGAREAEGDSAALWVRDRWLLGAAGTRPPDRGRVLP